MPKDKQQALELEPTIHAWESVLLHDRVLMSPSMQVIIESTIEHLKELKALLNSSPSANTQLDTSAKKVSENG